MRWILAFSYAFILNVLWENLHSGLYESYRGGPITIELLLIMAAKDALIIIVLIILFRNTVTLWRYPSVLLLWGVIISIVIEIHALANGRWSYAEAMPILPLLGTGLTPTVQLGITAYITYCLTFRNEPAQTTENNYHADPS